MYSILYPTLLPCIFWVLGQGLRALTTQSAGINVVRFGLVKSNTGKDDVAFLSSLRFLAAGLPLYL